MTERVSNLMLNVNICINMAHDAVPCYVGTMTKNSCVVSRVAMIAVIVVTLLLQQSMHSYSRVTNNTGISKEQNNYLCYSTSIMTMQKGPPTSWS